MLRADWVFEKQQAIGFQILGEPCSLRGRQAAMRVMEEGSIPPDRAAEVLEETRYDLQVGLDLKRALERQLLLVGAPE